jgi:hypothetical protein
MLPADADHDGINEDLEQKLAERFAPRSGKGVDAGRRPLIL